MGREEVKELRMALKSLLVEIKMIDGNMTIGGIPHQIVGLLPEAILTAERLLADSPQ